MPDSLEASLTGIFRDVFDDETIVLRPDLTANDVEGWDSLTHIRLLVAIQRKLRVNFTASEVGGMKTVGDLIQLIRGKLPAS